VARYLPARRQLRQARPNRLRAISNWAQVCAAGTGCGVCVGVNLPITVAAHGGCVPPGAHVARSPGVTVAVLTTVSGGSAAKVAVTVYTSVAPAENVATVSAIAPLPLALGQAMPPEAAQVQANASMPAGIGSLMSASIASASPTLRMVTV